MLMRKSEHSLIEALKPWTQTLKKGFRALTPTSNLLACKTVSCGPRVTPAEECPPSPPKAKAGRPMSGFTRLTKGSARSVLFVLAVVVAALIATVSPADAQTATVPDAPTGLSATVDSATQISLAWTPPNNGGSDITGYKIEYSAVPSDTNGWEVLEETTTTDDTYQHYHEIGPDIPLQYRVSAINIAGTGDSSDVADATTQAATDNDGSGAPDLTEVTVNFDQIVLTFDENLDNTSVPAFPHFRVNVVGMGPEKLLRPESVGIAEDTKTKVTLSLSEDQAVNASDRVKVHYNPPGIFIGNAKVPLAADALKDFEGNLVAQFLGSATNNTLPQVTLVLTPDRISENGGVSVVTATLPSPVSEDIMVAVIAEEVSSAVTTDFELSLNDTLTITMDHTTSTGVVEITAVDNEVEEADKMVTVRGMVMGGNAEVLSTASRAILTITEDDRPVITRPMIVTMPTETETDTDPMDDRAALVALYNATGGENWTASTNWNTSAPLGRWYGVMADAGGRVTGLNLGGNRLSGPIPAELASLSDLERLYLNDNQLTGMIPLTKLESSFAARNSVLQELALWGNDQLTGTEDISDELGRRIDRAVLRTLYKDNGGPQWEEDGNWLDPTDSFAFSDWYGIRTNDNGRVSELHLAGNGLKEELTNALEALDDLETLDLSGNADLNGTLPQGLMDLSKLAMLYIQDTGACAPEDAAFQQWLANIDDFRGENCIVKAEEAMSEASGGGCVIASDRWMGNTPESAAFNLFLIISALTVILWSNRSKIRQIRL